MDIKNLAKKGYRVYPEKRKVGLRVRVPAGDFPAKYLDILKDIALNYGNGNLHITARQGFEIHGIDIEKVEEINKKIVPIIEGLEKEIGVKIENIDNGYPAVGTRNICACLGNKICPVGFCDTKEMSKKIEKMIYPNDYHLKLAVAGCSCDCIKAHMQDVGIIAQIKPVYDKSKCISCQVCIKTCNNKATGAISITENKKIKIDFDRCIGCGECIKSCPNESLMDGKVYYKLVIMGRTGRKNPRIAKTFVTWASEEVVMKIIRNLYIYIDLYRDKSLAKERIGYIFDRTGYQTFKDTVLKGINLNEEIRIAEKVQFCVK